MNLILNRRRRRSLFSRRNRGVTGVEYGMIVGFVAIIIVSIVVTVGLNARSLYCSVATSIGEANGGPNLVYSPDILTGMNCSPTIAPLNFPYTAIQVDPQADIIDGNLDAQYLEDPVGVVFTDPSYPGFSAYGTQSFVQLGGQSGGGPGSPWAAISATSGFTKQLQDACVNGKSPIPGVVTTAPGPPSGIAQTTTVADTGAAELGALGVNPPGGYIGGSSPYFAPSETVVTCYAPGN